MTFQTIDDVKERNRATGHHFFDPATMRFFDSRISGTLYAGRYFVTSEKGPNGIRAYTIRIAHDDGTIGDIGGFQQYPTLAAAQRGVQALLNRDTIRGLGWSR